MGRKLVDAAVGRRLEELRTARGITQKRMAAGLRITPRMLRYYEQGKVAPPIARLGELANLLDCKLLELFEPPGSPVPGPQANGFDWLARTRWMRVVARPDEVE